ncbi:MAG: matrixin family metalloprotease [Myxococcaceae bacterium]|nr:matrixin family metalloprotease [Myxococcaceae bacterium]MCI0672241.1 matrixin family metalloprotease [Myxococcaceae bacterium]
MAHTRANGGLLRGLLPLLVALMAPPVVGYELRRDSTGEPVRWDARVRFVVDPAFDVQLDAADALSALQDALATYRDAGVGLQLEVVQGEHGGVGYDLRRDAPNQNTIVALDPWEYDASAIAVTVLTVDIRTHRILDADIALNAQHRSFRVLPPEGAPSNSPWDDVQNTLTHELGHAIGLAHNPAVPGSVMFPTALRGETAKRAFSADDHAGLEALYGGSAELEGGGGTTAGGCSTGGGSGGLFAVVVMLLMTALALRRRREAALLVVLAGPGALASTPEREVPDVAQASLVATGRVVRVQTLVSTGASGLLRTEVELEVERCYRGSCPTRLVVVRPGGRLGHVEQWVEGHELPRPGESLGVVQEEGSAATRMYSLERVRDLVAFARGLERLTSPPAPRVPAPPSAPTPARRR